MKSVNTVNNVSFFRVFIIQIGAALVTYIITRTGVFSNLGKGDETGFIISFYLGLLAGYLVLNSLWIEKLLKKGMYKVYLHFTVSVAICVITIVTVAFLGQIFLKIVYGVQIIQAVSANNGNTLYRMIGAIFPVIKPWIYDLVQFTLLLNLIAFCFMKLANMLPHKRLSGDVKNA